MARHYKYLTSMVQERLKMHSANKLIVLLLLLTLLTNGCGIEDNNSNSKEKLQVEEIETELQEPTIETVRMKNCGNKAPAEQISTRSQTISVEGAGELQVGIQMLKATIAAKYSETKEITKSQKLIAAPNTNMKFLLKWTQKTFLGFIKAEGKPGRAEYRVTVPLAVELVEAFDLGDCPTTREEKVARDISVTYKAHVANIGWMKWVENGEIAGTTGQGKRIEAIRVKLDDAYPGMGIKYRAHVAHLGWMYWVSNEEVAGTTGQNRQIEAIQIKLTNAPIGYKVNYQAHGSHLGWLSWVSDGKIAGTTGQGRQMEAIRIKIISP